MTTLDQSKLADEARDSVPPSGPVSSCNDWLEGQPLVVLTGDSENLLRHAVPDESVDCAVTSPPYWHAQDRVMDHALPAEERLKAAIIAQATNARRCELMRALDERLDGKSNVFNKTYA